jgi:hypothetical protein
MRLRPLFAAAGVAVVLAAGWLASRQPSATRTWADDHERLATITRRGDTAWLTNVRDFRYGANAVLERRWRDRVIRLDQVDRAWFTLVPLSHSLRAPAHSFVTFGFGDTATLSFSVEGRRELGEEYGVVAGALRSFELVYIVAEESDNLARRATLSDHPIYRLPVKGTRAGFRTVLADMLDRAEALRTTPAFYHTIWNNCTSNLVAHVNRVSPTRLPGVLAAIMPGYADAVIRDLDLVADSLPAERLRERYRVDDAARRAVAAGLSGIDFSRAMSAAVR